MGGDGALLGACLQVARDMTAREVVLKGEVAALKKDMGRLLKLLVATQVPTRRTSLLNSARQHGFRSVALLRLCSGSTSTRRTVPPHDRSTRASAGTGRTARAPTTSPTLARPRPSCPTPRHAGRPRHHRLPRHAGWSWRGWRSSIHWIPSWPWS